MHIILAILLFFGITGTLTARPDDGKQNIGLVSNIQSTPGLVALWDFKEKVLGM